jgi:hypothetical protein
LGSLTATTFVKGRQERQVELPLPPEAACIRLLRDPLSATAAPRVREPAARGPVQLGFFARHGRKLMARIRPDLVASQPVPSSPRAGVGKEKLFATAGRRVIAAGSYGKSTVVLDETGHIKWFGRECGRSANVEIAPDAAVLLMPNRVEKAALGRIVVLAENGPPIDMVVEFDGALFRIRCDQVGRFLVKIDLVCAEVSAVWVAGRGVAYMGRQHGAWVLDHVVRDEKEHPIMLAATGRAVYGYVGRLSPHPVYGFVAIETDPGVWTVVNRGSWQPLPRLDSGDVVGLCDARSTAPEPCLIVLSSDRCYVYLHGVGEGSRLIHSVDSIRSVAVCDDAPLIAYMTDSGERVVYSLATREVVLRLAGSVAG